MVLAETHCSRCHAIGDTDQSLMEGAPPFRDSFQVIFDTFRDRRNAIQFESNALGARTDLEDVAIYTGLLAAPYAPSGRRAGVGRPSPSSPFEDQDTCVITKSFSSSIRTRANRFQA